METKLMLEDGSTVGVGDVVRVMSRDGRRMLAIGAVEKVSVLGMAKIHGVPNYVAGSQVARLKGGLH